MLFSDDAKQEQGISTNSVNCKLLTISALVHGLLFVIKRPCLTFLASDMDADPMELFYFKDDLQAVIFNLLEEDGVEQEMQSEPIEY